MDWLTWEPYYLEVAKDLELDIAKDYAIAEKFSQLMQLHHPQGFDNIIQRIKEKKFSKAWIFGAGPSLESDFTVFKKYYKEKNDLIVGIDGSCLFLDEQGVIPDIIFSDLDGSLDTILKSVKNGSLLILHAHGDNFSIIEKLYPKISSHYFLPTVQTKPYEPFIYNLGGFTDGDRAISGMLEWFNNVNLLLLGFTFGTIQGRYSKPTRLKNHIEASQYKLKKLAFAKIFISKLAALYPNKIYNLSNPTDLIPGVSSTYVQ